MKIEKRRLRTMFAGIALLTASACDYGPSLSLANPAVLDSLIDGYVAAGGFPVLYARLEDREGRVIYEHGAIDEGLIPGRAIDGQTWFRVWSMSKIITISVAMDLVEEGILDLDDAVTEYLPEFESLRVAVSPTGEALTTLEDRGTACPLQFVPTTEEMTVADLINHEAGFYYAVTGIPCLDEPLAAANLPAVRNSSELVEALADLPLIQQPGNGYYYGTNTTVLGIVAERATGRSLAQLVEERVTGPLQIADLQYDLPADVTLLPRVSGRDGSLREAHPGELDIFGPDVPDYDPAHQLYLGGEGMIATSDGYADFLRMLLNRGELNGHRFLNEATIEEITSPHTQVDSEYGYNGYNLWVNSGLLGDGTRGVGGLWIGGGYEGTYFWIDPERGFVGLVMSQIYWTPESGQGRDDTIREAVYSQLTGY